MSTIDGLLAKMLHSTPQQFGWLCLTSSPPPYREMRRGVFFESSRTYHALARLWLGLSLLEGEVIAEWAADDDTQPGLNTGEE